MEVVVIGFAALQCAEGINGDKVIHQRDIKEKSWVED